MTFEKTLTGLNTSNLTSSSFLSILCSDKTVKPMGKRYYINDITTIEMSGEVSIKLEESILLILTNLEKELIENLPSDTINNSVSKFTKGWNTSTNCSEYSLNNDNESRTPMERGIGEDQKGQRRKGENYQKGFISKSKYFSSNENGVEGKTRNGFLKKHYNNNFSTLHPDESIQLGSQKQENSSSLEDFKEDPSSVACGGKWEKVKLTPPPEIVPFKPTEKLKPTDEFDKKIKEIRIFLNKMSESNYETQSNLVINIIEKHIINSFDGENTEPENVNKCIETTVDKEEYFKFIERFSLAILTILSGNTFLSSVYSKLYKELIGKYIIFEKTLHLFIENFKLKTEEEIHYINPDKDYDGYCKYVKNNDNRKATSLFIVNLVKINGLDKQYIIDILEHFLKKSLLFIDMENKTNEVEEITDNIFIIVSNIYSVIFKTDQWKNNIYPIILQISKMKNKEHLSISSRVIFKYMDVQEYINNFS